MIKAIQVPFLGANDDSAILLKWLANSGEYVDTASAVCILETTKTTIEINCNHPGFLYQLVAVGDRVSPQQLICILSSESITDVDREIQKIKSESVMSEKSNTKVTKKAEILINRHGLSQSDFDSNLKIDESTVMEVVNKKQQQMQRIGLKNLQRIGIVGGVSGGGALIVIDALISSKTQTPYCIFDEDEVWHGKSILGVPVVGNINVLKKMIINEELDAVVIAFNRNLSERSNLFNQLSSEGIPFCNVIDNTAQLRGLVVLGTGNIILGNCYIGACTDIGDNNFISANVCIEHGNKVGSSNAFGPGIFTSGNVTIGDEIRFGTGIFVEPNISIGNKAVISSGSVLIKNVLPNEIIKAKSYSSF